MSYALRPGSSNQGRRGRGQPYHGPYRHPSVQRTPQEDTQPNELLANRKLTGPPVVRSSAPPLPGPSPAYRGGRWTNSRPHGFSNGHPFNRHDNDRGGRSWNQDGPLRTPQGPLNSTAFARQHASVRPQNPFPYIEHIGTNAERPLHATDQSSSSFAAQSRAVANKKTPLWPPPKCPQKRRKLAHIGPIAQHTPPDKNGLQGIIQAPHHNQKIVSPPSVPAAAPLTLRALSPATTLVLSSLKPFFTTPTSTPICAQDLPPAPAENQDGEVPLASLEAAACASASIFTPAAAQDTPSVATIPAHIHLGATIPAAPTPSADTILAPQSPALVHPNSPPPDSNSVATTMPMLVKRERSPTPIINAPRLITEGCHRLAPLPPCCRNTCEGFRAARQQLANAEADKLRKMGLHPLRIFIREDGMAIDWKSPVPVCADTLLPPPEMKSSTVAAAAQQPAEPRYFLTQREQEAKSSKRRRKETLVSVAEQKSTSTLPLHKVSAPITIEANPSPSPQNEEYGGKSVEQPQLEKRSPTLFSSPAFDKTESPFPGHDHLRAASPRAPSVPAHHTSPRLEPQPTYFPSAGSASRNSPPIAGPSSSNIPAATASRPLPTTDPLQDAKDPVLEFLYQYVQTFTTNRAALESAYAPCALFSFQAHNPEDNPQVMPPAPPHCGRTAVLKMLLSLPGNFTPCNWPPTSAKHDLHWEAACVPGSPHRDVLLMCYAVQEWSAGTGADGDARSQWSCEQRFLLRPRGALHNGDLDQDQGQGSGGAEDNHDGTASTASPKWPYVIISHQMRFRRLPELRKDSSDVSFLLIPWDVE